MKKSIASFACILILALFSQLHASGIPSRYLWTGAVSNNWMTAGNWTYVSGPVIPGGYPGAGGPSAAVPSIRHIAMFDASSNVNCNIGGSYYPSGGFYIGGIEVNGYTGTITQLSGNRLYISDTYFPSGAYDNQYKAIFNFGSGGKFAGSNYTYTAGSEPYQDVISIEIAVELSITGGTFQAPRAMFLANSASINTANFDATTNAGVVKLYPRSGFVPATTGHQYEMNFSGVNFFELQVYGLSVNFLASDFNVLNDLITSGGSLYRIDNGTIHVKERVLVNETDATAYAGGSPGGNGTIVLDGSIQQSIIKTSGETAGSLPGLVINNAAGVKISGLVSSGGPVVFQNGIVSPLTSSTSDVFVFLLTSTVSGASDASHVEGTVKKHALTNATFEFPVGKNGFYHPIFISNVSGGGGATGTTSPGNYTQFTAEYFDTPTPFTSNLATGTFAVHDCQYWTLQRNNKPTSNAKVSLSWNANTCNNSYFTSTTNLRVAQYDGSLWQNRGTSGIVSFASGQKISEATGTALTQFNAATPTMFTFCQSAAPFIATISSSTNVTCNGGNDGSATVTTTGGIGTLTYSWNTVPVQTSATASGLSAGTYTVTVNSSSGQIATATVTITEPAPLVVTLTSLSTICSSSFPVLLTNGSPAGGIYSGGAYITSSGGNYYFDPSVSGVGTFPLTYTYTNPSGCVGTATTTITVALGPDRPLGWEWATEPTTANVSRGNDIAVDPATGNSYTIGNFSGSMTVGSTTLTSVGGEDVFVICHDASGIILWVTSYGGTSDDFGTGVAVSGSTIGISGYFYGTSTFGSTTLTSNGDRDGFVAALDALGNLLFVQNMGGIYDDQANAISSDANYFYVAGYIDYGSGGQTVPYGSGVTTTGNQANSFIAKYAKLSGVCSWATKGSADWQKASAIDVNSNGNITVGGYSTFLPNYFLESYDASGTLLNFNYIEGYPTGTYDYLQGIGGIGHDASGNIYVTGIYSDVSGGASTANFNIPNVALGTYSYPYAPIVIGPTTGFQLNGIRNEVYDAVYDANLNLTYAKNIGANSGYFPSSDILVTPSGDQYITGTFIGTISDLCFSMGSFGYDDIFVMKLDNAGNFQWAQKPDGGYYEINPAIDLDNSGNVYIAGIIAGTTPVNFGSLVLNSGYTNSFTAKLSPTGSSNYRQAGETIAAEENKSNELSVYPNPNNGSFIISTSSEPKDVFVYDMTGKLVFSKNQTTENTIAVDITNEAKGLYLIKVVTGNSIQTQRVVNQ